MLRFVQRHAEKVTGVLGMALTACGFEERCGT